MYDVSSLPMNSPNNSLDVVSMAKGRQAFLLD